MATKKKLITCCMIVKDEAEILEKTLSYVKPIVDTFLIVDTGSSDGTQDIIKKYGKLHEIPFVNYVDTKNEVIKLAKTPYILWMDADEICYQNVEKLRKYAEDGVDAVSCLITEGTDDYNVVGNQYQRIRLFKKEKDYKFYGPGVHEYLSGEGTVVFDTSILVRHEHKKKNKASTARERFLKYIDLLQSAIAKNENDQRAWFYLGRTYKDLNEPMLAVSAYQKYLTLPNNFFRDEKWQASYDMACCLKQTGDYEQAFEACNLAISIDSRRAETFVLLGNLYFAIQNHEKAIENYEHACSLPIPYDVVLFLNPEMHGRIPKDQLVLCYYKTNQFDKAEKLANEIKDKDHRKLNNLWWCRSKTRQKIFFTLNHTPEPIWGGIIEQQGVHGVETTYIELPKEFARKGHDVYLFCTTNREHVYDGVYYIPYQNLPNYWQLEPDLVVTSRDFGVLYQTNAKKIIWFQDAHFAPPQYPDAFDRADAIVCSSLWHRCYIAERFEHGIKADKINIIPLGIRKELFTKPIPKIKNKVIYSSNPDRGLYILADMWEELTRRISNINLTICYGWEGLSTWNQSEEWQRSVEGQKAALLNKLGGYENVRFTGRITKKELAREMLSSELMLYPNNFWETFCISTLEAQIAGTPIITTDMGALSTTVDRNLNSLLKGSPYSKEYQREFVHRTEELLTNPPLLQEYQIKNRISKINSRCDWSDIVEDWERLIWSL